MPALLRRCAAAALCAAALAYAAFSFGGVLRIVARARLAPIAVRPLSAIEKVRGGERLN